MPDVSAADGDREAGGRICVREDLPRALVVDVVAGKAICPTFQPDGVKQPREVVLRRGPPGSSSPRSTSRQFMATPRLKAAQNSAPSSNSVVIMPAQPSAPEHSITSFVDETHPSASPPTGFRRLWNGVVKD